MSGSKNARASAGVDRTACLALAIGSVCLTLIIGQGILFLAPGPLLMAPLAGIMTALAVRRPLDAAASALVSVPLGTLAATMVSRYPIVPAAAWLPDALTTAAVAAVVASAARWGLGRLPRWRSALSGLAVALVVIALVYASMTAAASPDPQGTTAAASMSATSGLTAGSNDPTLFLRAIGRMRWGVGYYRAMAETLVESNEVGRPLIDAAAVFSYRPPTLYAYFAALPVDGTWVVLSLALLGAASSVAAYLLARTAVREPLALVGCVAVATYLGTVAGTAGALGAEPYAGALGVIAIALFALSQGRRTRAGFMWAAAGVALLAALVRELAMPLLALGLLATTVDPESRRRRDWVAWSVALAFATAAYLGHYLSVRAVVSAVGIVARPSDKLLPWLSVDGLGLRAAVYRLGAVIGTKEAFAWALVVAGWVGSVVGMRERSAKVLVGGATVGGAFLYLFFHPSGVLVGGLPPAYWGDVIIPTTIACAPMCLTLVVWMRGESDEDEPRGDSAATATGSETR